MTNNGTPVCDHDDMILFPLRNFSLISCKTRPYKEDPIHWETSKQDISTRQPVFYA